MRYLVACPGPSLSALPDRGAGDVTIAVNIAARRGCDWVVSYDESMLQHLADVPRLGTLTTPGNADKYGFLGTDDVAACGWAEEIEAARSYSKLGAFVLAAYLGARVVEVYGDDMGGREYHDGTTSPWLNDLRWAREREHTQRVELLLSGRGVTITRRVA